MTYASGYGEPSPPMVGPYTPGWGPIIYQLFGAAPSSGAYETASRAVYVPFLIRSTCVVRRIWWANGATVNASYNVDCAIYADAGAKPGVKIIGSGGTAQGTASQIQFVDVTDTTLAAARYWMGFVCDTISATFFRIRAPDGDFQMVDAAFRFQESSAYPLPATATPVESSNNYFWLCGFSTVASP